MEADIKFMKGPRTDSWGTPVVNGIYTLFFINKLSAAGEMGFKTQVQIG